MEERRTPTVRSNLNKKRGNKSNSVKKSCSNPFLLATRLMESEYKVYGSTQFSLIEVQERAELFKREYDRKDLHDRVLVLQVMPDDYEMRELTARLELNDCITSTVVNEVESMQCRENSSEKSTLGFCSDIMHTKEEVSKQSTIDLIASDRATQDEPRSRHEQDSKWSSSAGWGRGNCSASKSETSYSCEDSEPEINLSFAEKFGSQRQSSDYKSESAIYSGPDYQAKSEETDIFFRYCHESKTGRSDIVCDESVNHEDIAREKGKSKQCTVETKAMYNDIEAIDYSSEVYLFSEPIPRKRNVFQEDQEVSINFPENEGDLKRYPENDAIESGRIKIEPAVAYGDKTGIESVEPNGKETIGIESAKYGKGTESGMLSEYDQDSSAGRVCDVHVLREHRIYVHACWLAVNSLYFRSLLFESGMRECTSAEFCMKVTESEENAFMSLLQSIYDLNVLDGLDIIPLMSVLRLSVKYDVRFSTLKAKRVLQAMPLTLEVCETIIEAVSSGGLPDLSGVMKNVEQLLLSEFEPLDETWESEKFATLSEPALRFLLDSDRLIVHSENTVFIALMQWIAKNAELYEDITEYSDLLNLVRFEVMKPTYIHDVVREHEIATQLDNFDALYLKAITYHALPRKRRGNCAKNRQWCEPRTPTFMWILYPEPEMFSFDEETSSSSTESSSFWYFGYKMHLRLNLSTSQDETGLVLVVENLVEDGSVELAYDVDVKFGEGLHRSFTCERFVYRGNDRSPSPGNYPFDDKYSVNEIREIVLGGSVKVAITFEITVEKILND